MLVGLLPAGAAGEDVSGLTLKYTVEDIIASMPVSFRHDQAFTLDKSLGFFKLKYSTAYNNSSGITTSANCLIFRNTSPAQHMVFEVYVPENGNYKMKANIRYHCPHPIAVYKLPTETTDFSILDSRYRVGTIKDPSYNNVDISKHDLLDDDGGIVELELTQGENYIAFSPEYNASITNSAYYASIGSFYLISGDGSRSVILGTALDDLSDGKADILGIMSDDTRQKLANDKITAKRFESSDTSVATVDNDGNITDVSSGEATITAYVTVDGRDYTLTGSYVAVAPGDGITIRYDLAEIMQNRGLVYSDTAKHPLFKDVFTYENSNNFFKWVSSTANDSGSKLRYRGNHLEIIQVGGMFAFEVNVPKTGKYKMKMYNGISSGAGDVNVYLSQGNYSLNDNDLKGSYNCWASYPATYFTTAFNTAGSYVKDSDGKDSVFTLKGGEKYIFTFKSTGTDSTGRCTTATRGSVGNFELIAGEDSVIMGIKVKVAEGKAQAVAHMSDGSEGDLADVESITYEGSDDTKATVDPVTGDIEDTGLGEVEILATVKLKSGEEYTAKRVYKALKSEKTIDITYDICGDLRDAGLANTENTTFMQDLVNWELSRGFYDWIAGSAKGFNSGSIYLRARPTNLQIGADRFIAFEVFVPQAGRYKMEIDHGATDQGTNVDVFLSQGNYSTNQIDYLSSYSCYDKNVAYNPNYFGTLAEEPAIIEDIKILEAGYYVFTFLVNDGDATQSIGYGSVGSFRLTNGNDAVMLGVLHDGDREKTQYISAELADKELIYSDAEKLPETKVITTVKNPDGSIDGTKELKIRYRSSDEKVATVASDGTVTGYSDGEAVISVTAEYDGKTYGGELTLPVSDWTGVKSAYLDAPEMLYVRDKAKLSLVAVMNSGNEVFIPSEEVTFSMDKEGAVSISDEGMMTGVSENEVTVTAETKGEFRGAESVGAAATVQIVYHQGKSEPNYYTYEKRENAMQNIKKYDWAKSTQKSAISDADRYFGNWEAWVDSVIGEGVPRTRTVGQYGDPQDNYCRYCGENVEEEHGGWKADIINRPWKLQCPACKRLFPSNDFEKFLDLGMDRQGYFDLDRAYEKHKELFADEYEKSGYKDQGYGYLKNVLYPEISNQRTPDNGGEADAELTINCGAGLRPGETVEGWGVDDSFGYMPKDKDGNSYMADAVNDIPERHAYIAKYNIGLGPTQVMAIDSLAKAYLYTGDVKYGRAGAILLDRMADVFESYDFAIQNTPKYIFWGADGGNAKGKFVGNISDSNYAQYLAEACDILYPMLTDDYVINYLSEKAKKLGLENDKTSSRLIWNNWEKGVLIETFTAAKERKIEGNFALGQTAVAIAAVALNREPETTEMVKWIYRTGANGTGGNVLAKIVDSVCRDGFGNETSENYNGMWISSVAGIADYLSGYEGSENLELYQHPKFAQMFFSYKDKVSLNNQYANIGDNGDTAALEFRGIPVSTFVSGFAALRGTPFEKSIAEMIFLRNGQTTEGLKYGIFDEDPERLEDEIEEVLDGGIEQDSDLLAGYGFAILRDGENHTSVNSQNQSNTLRDFWIHFGKSDGHAHHDTLNIGVDAYGLNISPDLGYPATTGIDPERAQWTSSTLSHNTVAIGTGKQESSFVTLGRPAHFDDSGAVKLIDVDAADAWKDAEIFRRTLVMVEVDDNVSYGVDFFRVLGGTLHTYSFHGQAENAYAVEGLDSMKKQVDENGNWTGTYAEGPDENGVMHYGVNVPYKDLSGSWTDENGNPNLLTEPGRDPWTRHLWDYSTYFQRGTTWLSKVRRDTEPDNKFAVEFDIKDYRKTVVDSKDIKLRITQMNNFTPDEVAIAAGSVPKKKTNAVLPKTFDYMFVRHRSKNGEKLDSMFTSVIEPYKGERYISSISPVEVTGEVKDGEMVRAVKVEHVGGNRTDYIVYATDNSVTYTVDGKFTFRGFVGVLSLNKNGAAIYRYVNDGDIIDGSTGKAGAYTGTVADFDDVMTFGDFENWIDIKLDPMEGMTTEDVIEDIIGKVIYIDNDDKESGAYEILGAEENGDGTVRLDIGTVNLARAFKDSTNSDVGYVYNIDTEQTFVIPSAYIEDMSPEFEPVSDNITTSAGSTVSVKVNAKTDVPDVTLSYEAAQLPRGASFNKDTATFMWKPDSSQVGENHVAITVRDSDGRESTTHFTVTVYGSTTSRPSNDEKKENNSQETPSDNTGTTGGGGGGGGGGAAPTDKPDDETNTAENGEEPDASDDDENTQDAAEASGETDSIRFTDIKNHSWAEDAIAELSEKGVIKGTSDTTYSPASNITRADFALLLVRAFELESNNAENFADVSENDYFAQELAIARNCGIVGGIGDNKYAPRNTITRQDMMVIVYRALQNLNVGFGIYDEPQYEDFTIIADYAKPAVSALIGAGLVNGKSGHIAPTDYTTRAEVAVLIKRILDYAAK